MLASVAGAIKEIDRELRRREAQEKRIDKADKRAGLRNLACGARVPAAHRSLPATCVRQEKEGSYMIRFVPFMYETMQGIGKDFGSTTLIYPIDPGQKQKAVLKVSAEYPLVSGAIMLGMSNDGFFGPQSIDMFKIDKPTVFDLYAYFVSDEQTTEKKE